jgi:hypothetical protein
MTTATCCICRQAKPTDCFRPSALRARRPPTCRACQQARDLARDRERYDGSTRETTYVHRRKPRPQEGP